MVDMQHETIELLQAELRRAQREIRANHRVIASMRETLLEHNLPVQHTIGSLRLCLARDDEEPCPLSLAPINSSPPPFEGCDLVALDPLRADYRCAELACGHRFNAVWLMHHFVRASTFRCPVCRRGKRRFEFDASLLPEQLVNKGGRRGFPSASV